MKHNFLLLDMFALIFVKYIAVPVVWTFPCSGGGGQISAPYLLTTEPANKWTTPVRLQANNVLFASTMPCSHAPSNSLTGNPNPCFPSRFCTACLAHCPTPHHSQNFPSQAMDFLRPHHVPSRAVLPVPYGYPPPEFLQEVEQQVQFLTFPGCLEQLDWLGCPQAAVILGRGASWQDPSPLWETRRPPAGQTYIKKVC